MKRDIKFRDDMKKAALDGRKTHTRRPFDIQPTCTPTFHEDPEYGIVATWPGESEFDTYECHCRHGKPGDTFELDGVTFEIVDVRGEQIQNITEEGARAEGIIDGGCLNCGEREPCGCSDPKPDARDAFAYLWHTIYPCSWDRNDWVWDIRFRRINA